MWQKSDNMVFQGFSCSTGGVLWAYNVSKTKPPTSDWSPVMTSMDGLCSFGTSGEKGSATLILKLIFCAGKLSDVMYVPPWACHRERRKQGRNRSPIDRSHWSLPFWLACVGLFFLPRFCALKTSYPLHRYLACQFFPLHFWIRFMVYTR